MAAVTFVPASTFIHMEASGRELKFEQLADGRVIVWVQYGSSHPINNVFQNNITISRGPATSTTLGAMNNEARKMVLQIIERGEGVEIATENGPVSTVASRRFNGNYHQMTSITISY